LGAIGEAAGSKPAPGVSLVATPLLVPNAVAASVD
jgi:hypothetical protein